MFDAIENFPSIAQKPTTSDSVLLKCTKWSPANFHYGVQIILLLLFRHSSAVITFFFFLSFSSQEYVWTESSVFK